ncbi:Blp family class II bacteriocin [Lacticaseibacillus paracasei]|uniref:Blp family class II bacteriocin n=1 Tax=Lacticaseibacillus paracasei TaxID=1597 RepID=UPI0022EC4CF1|nr:Blp family class II bacteriocin [Lacticaseibacillus paracasei]WBS99274.1 Blp family class II bacteriocin [Lacticaseibacillus paracasei]
MNNMRELNLDEMQSVTGGGNVSNCLLSVAAMTGGLATGQLWATVAAGAAAFSSGYSCAALAHEGD